MRLPSSRVTTTVMISPQATEKKLSPIPTRRCRNITRIMTRRPTP
jgi:hypothetical protein